MTTTPIDAQIINGSDGRPEFAVIPYELFQQLTGAKSYSDHVPHEVVSRMVDGASAARAWREHLNLTQTEMAQRMGITQAANSQLESSTRLRNGSRAKIAHALDIRPGQLV